MSIASAKEVYLKKGVAVLPAVFTEEECDRMKVEAYSVTDEQITKARYPHVPSEQAYNKKSLIFFPALANFYLNRVRTDPRMVHIISTFLGDNVRQINNQVYFREPNDLDTFAWHRDDIFRESDLFTEAVSTDYLQTIIAIDDITEDNGAVEFIEGSHKWPSFDAPRDLRNFNRSGLSGTKYIALKGDVMLWSVMIVHGSEANTSNLSRMTYMNGFCKADSVSSYPDYLKDGKVVQEINPENIP
jgi:ectoine hydroxylase-related dioxygenase (phytanoyl-CoA dioxygenase family)